MLLNKNEDNIRCDKHGKNNDKFALYRPILIL